MNGNRLRHTRREIVRLSHAGLDWIAFSTQVSEILHRLVRFDRSCWHTVDPSTVLFTGSLNHRVSCSGSWLAEHEYVIDDVNKWSFLARSGRLAGATGLATHGDLSRSARHLSHQTYGIGDELRGSFVVDGTYWGAAGFLRNSDEPWFTEEDVRALTSLCEPIAAGFRRALLIASTTAEHSSGDDGPGVVVFDEEGEMESISPAAERWIEQIVEVPRPTVASESKVVQIVAARARTIRGDQDPLEFAARVRARTGSGEWLLVYGTQLSGGAHGRTAVIIQRAAPNDVAALVALAYGLSERERQVSRLCMDGRSTKQIAQMLQVSPFTVQDHLKSIFEKTGVRSRGELVGQIFLEHYVPRWEEQTDCPSGWCAKASHPRPRVRA